MTVFIPGDMVRVRDDAYKSRDVAKIHNGRICEVIRVVHGDVVVRSIDDHQPQLNETTHSPSVLEKL